MVSLHLAEEPTGQGRPLLAKVRTAVTPEGQSLERAGGEFSQGGGGINVIDLGAGFMNLWKFVELHGWDMVYFSACMLHVSK